MKTILETRRLLLREMSLPDLDFIARLLAQPEVMAFWPKCYSRQESLAWIQRQQARYQQDGVGYWLALDKSSMQPVGQAGLLSVQIDGACELGLGYIIDRPFWRMGYATEAAQASRDYGFAQLGRSQIVALVRPENIPSQGVARKIGMTVSKHIQHADYDHLVFAAKRPD